MWLFLEENRAKLTFVITPPWVRDRCEGERGVRHKLKEEHFEGKEDRRETCMVWNLSDLGNSRNLHAYSDTKPYYA